MEGGPPWLNTHPSRRWTTSKLCSPSQTVPANGTPTTSRCWRAARGEAGLTAWRWWAKAADDDEYANELATREEAIAWARREYRGEAITIVEARCFADEIEGDEISSFAEMRNLEHLPPEDVL